MTIWKTCIYALLVAVLIALFVVAAKAQEPSQTQRCAPVGQMFKVLKDKYHETMVFASADSPQAFVITKSKKGTWTLLRLVGDGENICIIAAGEKSRLFIQGLGI